MGERVHPYVVQGSPIHYPSPLDAHHGNLQPRSDGGEAILMRKEQEQRLLATHIEAVHELEGANAGTEHARRKQQQRRRCVCCCCCVGATVATFVVLVGILVLLFFLVLHPKLPKYTITQANMTKFSMSNSTSTGDEAEEGTLFLNAEMQFMVRMRNPNKKIAIDYRSISAALFYEGVDIGEGSIPQFYQGHNNITYVELPMVGHHIPLTPSLGTTLRETLTTSDNLTLHARAIIHVRVKIGHWTSHTSKVRVKCHIQISNPTRGNVRLLNNGCKFKLLRLRL